MLCEGICRCNMNKEKNFFPIYRNNKDLIYLDYAATTFMPDSVIESLVYYHSNVGVGLYRGNGALSTRAEVFFENGKKSILEFFSAGEKYDVIFGKNATECLNVLANSFSKILHPGDIVLTTPYEHHSNILPWKKVVKDVGACLVQLPMSEDGSLEYNFIKKLDVDRIKVFTGSYISNVNGHVLNIERIKESIGKNVISILDVSQAVGHKKLSFEEMDFTAYVMSAHKMYGPKNIGAAIINSEFIDSMEPLLLGGGMVWNSLSPFPVWHKGVRKFDAGTFDCGLVYAWSKACEFLKDYGFLKLEERDRSIYEIVKEEIKKLDVNLVQGSPCNTSLCSFKLRNKHPHDLSEWLSTRNIEIRTGHMCSQDAMNSLNCSSVCRMSWGIGVDESDVKKCLMAVKEFIKC